MRRLHELVEEGGGMNDPMDGSDDLSNIDDSNEE